MWLFITFLIGISVIVLELSLETILICLERHKIVNTTSMEWFGNSTLQLQRMAHEELGLGDWEGCGGKAVPVTRKGELLGVFAMDPKHIKLVNLSQIAQETESATKPDSLRDQEGAGNQSEMINEWSGSVSLHDESDGTTSNPPTNTDEDPPGPAKDDSYHSNSGTLIEQQGAHQHETASPGPPEDIAAAPHDSVRPYPTSI